MPGRFHNTPLVPSIAREIIRELFGVQTTWRKNAIDQKVDELHRMDGGLPGRQSVSLAVKKALQDLQSDGYIVNRYGHWHLFTDTDEGSEGSVSDDAMPEEEVSVAYEQDVSQAVDIQVEKVIGDGVESVYVYFNPNDRKLATLEGRDVWECKVGKTSDADALARVFSLRTALSHQPVVGLLIKTQDSSALEKALHAALRLVDAAVPDSPGTEWFMTSPTRIEQWYEVFRQSLHSLSDCISNSSLTSTQNT